MKLLFSETDPERERTTIHSGNECEGFWGRERCDLGVTAVRVAKEQLGQAAAVKVVTRVGVGAKRELRRIGSVVCLQELRRDVLILPESSGIKK